MHALAQLSTLVFLQLEARWASTAHSQGHPAYHAQHQKMLLEDQRCSPPRSLGSQKYLHVLRFVHPTHYKYLIPRPDDLNIDLPDLDPAEAVARIRLTRAVQTGCTVVEYNISVMRNQIEEEYDHALPLL